MLATFSMLNASAKEAKIATAIADDDDPMDVVFSVELNEPVDGADIDDGTTVRWTLKKDITVYDRTIAPAGSTVIAHVDLPLKKNGARAHPRTGRLHLRHALHLHFDKIITPQHQELNIDGSILPQNVIFNNGTTFRRLSAGANGEIVSAQDIDLVQVTEIGFAVPKEYVDRKSIFNVCLKEGDELKVQATINPSYNLSGKILKSAPNK
jgi:hypothetical protein